jgi:hypothetical protein
MANQAAWQAGWARGAGTKKDNDLTKQPKGGGRKARGGIASDVGGQVQSTVKQRGFAPSMPLPGFGSIKPMKKGGPIKKTGIYLLHKNEYVVPAKHRSAASGRKVSRKRSVIKP